MLFADRAGYKLTPRGRHLDEESSIRAYHEYDSHNLGRPSYATSFWKKGRKPVDLKPGPHKPKLALQEKEKPPVKEAWADEVPADGLYDPGNRKDSAREPPWKKEPRVPPAKASPAKPVPKLTGKMPSGSKGSGRGNAPDTSRSRSCLLYTSPSPRDSV